MESGDLPLVVSWARREREFLQRPTYFLKRNVPSEVSPEGKFSPASQSSHAHFHRSVAVDADAVSRMKRVVQAPPNLRRVSAMFPCSLDSRLATAQIDSHCCAVRGHAYCLRVSSRSLQLTSKINSNSNLNQIPIPLPHSRNFNCTTSHHIHSFAITANRLSVSRPTSLRPPACTSAPFTKLLQPRLVKFLV